MTEEQEVTAIPLVEERAVIAKREIETGRYRVRVSVEEREDFVPVELSHVDAEIERVPINRAVSQLPSVRLEGSTTIIPVVEEVMVMEKRLIVVEEIHVRRKSVTQTQQVPVRIKFEQVHIDRSGNAAEVARTDEQAGPGARQ